LRSVDTDGVADAARGKKQCADAGERLPPTIGAVSDARKMD
jgi:hypothetical protein